MARFIDLEDEDENGAAEDLPQQHLRRQLHEITLKADITSTVRPATPPELPTRIDNAITRAFSCYPYVFVTVEELIYLEEHGEKHRNLDANHDIVLPSVTLAIVSNIDLNTLDSLARTSYYIHNALIQYRRILLRSTLHCSNEEAPVDRDETFRYRARATNWYYMEDGRNYNGKSGDCARDLVGQCRRCGEVVCRVRRDPYANPSLARWTAS